MTTPLQEAFPDVDIIEGVTEFVVIKSEPGNLHRYQKGETILLDSDDGSDLPYFINKNDQKRICISLCKIKLKENKMTKTVKVENGKFEIPEGHEIDTVTFKKSVNNRPRSWDEYIESDHPFIFSDRQFINKSTAPEEYKALRKLQLMRDVWVGDWVADWKNTINAKWVIEINKYNAKVDSWHAIQSPLSFPSSEMAEDFLEAHKELIETAKPLL